MNTTPQPRLNALSIVVADMGAALDFYRRCGLTFADGISDAGKYVELEAKMDVLVMISNCPQLNNPCNGWNPTPIEVLVWS